jgi:hypothetical protein
LLVDKISLPSCDDNASLKLYGAISVTTQHSLRSYTLGSSARRRFRTTWRCWCRGRILHEDLFGNWRNGTRAWALCKRCWMKVPFIKPYLLRYASTSLGQSHTRAYIRENIEKRAEKGHSGRNLCEPSGRDLRLGIRSFGAWPCALVACMVI